MDKLFVCLLVAAASIDRGSSIACYQCFSVNGSNPACEDYFQGDLTDAPSLLQPSCMTNIRGRHGIFPATHCIKLVVYVGSPPVQHIYRTCSRDEGEFDGITRSSHCGYIKLSWLDENRRFRGCLHTCDKDTCNRASAMLRAWQITLLPMVVPCLIYLPHRCFSLT